jgi:hypothetical protein
MQRRKQAAKQSMRKRSVAKKATHKKTGRKKTTQKKIRLAQGIGIISSIKFHGTVLEGEFKRGANIGADPPYADGSYDRVMLAAAVHRFNKDASIGLIVAVGGLGSAMEAFSNATKPWIALIGGAPGSFPSSTLSWFYGGVSVDTYARNVDRIRHLTNIHHIQLQDICLLFNPNSECSATETNAWGGATPVAAGRNAYGVNDVATYGPAFASIPANVKAVVVSADPFFQDTKDDLIDAANGWVNNAPMGTNRRVCYPLQNYANTGKAHQPQAGHHTLHGPELKNAYYALGQKAATILSSGMASTLDPVPIGNPQDH